MFIDFIPESIYTSIFYHFVMVITLLSFLHTQYLAIGAKHTIHYSKFLGGVLLIFVLIYMGFRPVYSDFVDMGTYNRLFDYYKIGNPVISTKDPFFHHFTRVISQYFSNPIYFFVCASIYVIPLYLVSKKWFGQYWFYSFLLFIGSFSFWSYGVNGIRNGMAGSLFLLGISYDRRLFQILFLSLAMGMHKSIMLPILAFVLVQFYNKPKTFLMLWFLSIPVSLMMGSSVQNLIADFILDERANYLTGEVNSEKFKNIGFRWDFLFYSSFGVVAGWYYIFKKKINDYFYNRLYNVYLISNTVWILLIKANFSNRFAYLSWFMMAVIIIFPWIKYNLAPNQHRKLGVVVLSYVGFTYAMKFIYYGNVLI